MLDAITNGTGNSRYLKSVSDFLTKYPTHEALADALVAGTLPIDLNGINPNGWAQPGTPLDKASLLTDATAARNFFRRGEGGAVREKRGSRRSPAKRFRWGEEEGIS